jgi:iron complex outermembrane recepter protein
LKTVFIAAFLLFSSIKSNSQNCALYLKGHIEDADTRQKLSGASVLLVELNRTIITDDKGDFIFKELCSANYTLRVSHIDCDPYEQNLNLVKSRHIDINLPHAKNTLDEVTLTSQKGTPNTGFKKELSARDMEETKGLSLAEALSRLNGVSMLQTGSTISKPIIHGLHSNRILTINNGVRQEGQQWGNEHAPEIDPFIAGKLTVIKGVDELKYGSDAIGGVILIEPKALMNTPGYTAELNTAFFTNNGQYLVSGMFEQQFKNLPALTYRLQGTYKKAANASTPGYRLNNTGMEEKNFSLTTAWRKNHFSTELFYSFFDTQVGIFEGAHIGNITDLENAISSDKPDPVFTGDNTYQIGRPYQDVNHQLLKSKTVYNAGNHKLSLLIAAQKNDRKEYDIIRNTASTKPQIDLSIVTLSQELTWEYNKNKWIHLAGISAMQQENQYAGRYFIPAYHSVTLGGYYLSKWQQHKWNLEAGVRWDDKQINSNRLLSGGVVFDKYSFAFSTLGSSFNAGYKNTQKWKLNANIALANRAPHVNELLSNGIHHGTATYEVGDILLKPEQSFNLSLNNSWSSPSGKVNVEATIYRNDISNFIYQQPKPDEPVLTIAGAFPKLVYVQNDVLLQGIDFSSAIQFSKKWSWDFKYAMLRARNTDFNDWLIRMPADRFQNELTFNFADIKKFSNAYISAAHSYTLEQTRVPDEKNGRQDYKAAPGAFGLVNIDAGTTILVGKKEITCSVAVKNLLNKTYRDYLNNLRYFTDETGRNIQVRVKIPFKKLS